MSDFFCSIMEDLHQLFGMEIPKNIGVSVYFKFRSSLKIGFEMRDDPHGLLMVSELGNMPRGASRMLWAQEALRWNAEEGSVGALCWNPTIEVIMLSNLFTLDMLTAQTIFETVPMFEQRALVWKEAIDRGYPPVLPGASAVNVSPREAAIPYGLGRYAKSIRP